MAYNRCKKCEHKLIWFECLLILRWLCLGAEKKYFEWKNWTVPETRPSSSRKPCCTFIDQVISFWNRRFQNANKKYPMICHVTQITFKVPLSIQVAMLIRGLKTLDRVVSHSQDTNFRTCKYRADSRHAPSRMADRITRKSAMNKQILETMSVGIWLATLLHFVHARFEKSSE
jgi:hypothetical protein